MAKSKYTRRADGLYRYQLYVGTDESGKKKYAFEIMELAKEISEATE